MCNESSNSSQKQQHTHCVLVIKSFSVLPLQGLLLAGDVATQCIQQGLVPEIKPA
jgi:hypothetical protein